MPQPATGSSQEQLSTCIRMGAPPNIRLMLQITDLTYRIGDRLLIDRASVTLPGKAKTGLVGRNGAGKSTLFKIITGDLSTETGSVQIPKRARIGQVAQEAPGTEETLMEVVLAADKERSQLLAEAETQTDPARIAEIHTRLADIGAHTAEARAGSILSGLGFDAAAQQRPCSSFSGGWRMRVALAAVLFPNPTFFCSTSRRTISILKARCGWKTMLPATRIRCF